MIAGEEFPLECDSTILEISAPKANLEGPYAVVFKDLTSSAVILRISWGGEMTGPNLENN